MRRRVGGLVKNTPLPRSHSVNNNNNSATFCFEQRSWEARFAIDKAIKTIELCGIQHDVQRSNHFYPIHLAVHCGGWRTWPHVCMCVFPHFPEPWTPELAGRLARKWAGWIIQLYLFIISAIYSTTEPIQFYKSFARLLFVHPRGPPRPVLKFHRSPMSRFTRLAGSRVSRFGAYNSGTNHNFRSACGTVSSSN